MAAATDWGGYLCCCCCPTAHLQVGTLGDEVWQGVRNKYWKFPLYFLPVCRKEGEVPSEEASRDPGAAAAAEAVVAEAEAEERSKQG